MIGRIAPPKIICLSHATSFPLPYSVVSLIDTKSIHFTHMETSNQFSNAMSMYIYPLHNRIPLSPGMLFSLFLYGYIPEITQLTVPLSSIKVVATLDMSPA